MARSLGLRGAWRLQEPGSSLDDRDSSGIDGTGRVDENTAIRTAPQPRQPARQLRGRGIAGGGQRARARQVLPLEVREAGLDRCEPRVLVPELLGFALDLLHPQFVLHPALLVLHLAQLDAGIPSPVERLQPQAPLRQRCTRHPIAGGAGRRSLRGRRCGHRKRAGRSGQPRGRRAPGSSPGDPDSSGVEAGPRFPRSLAQIRERGWLRERNRPAPRPDGIKQTA